MADNVLNYLIKAAWTGKNATKEAAGDISKLGDAGERAASKTDKTTQATSLLGGSLAKILATGAIIGVTKQLVDFGLNAADVASSTQQQYQKFETVFGDFAASAEANLDDLADATRNSSHALIGYASTIQDTLVPMGIARGEAAGLSQELVELGLDLAAFNDLEVDDAMRRLQGTLIGSHENALAFGVVINENTLKAELAAQGWDKLSGAQLEAAKVQARVNLLMAGTTDAVGTAIEEADGYAGAQRSIAAAMEELNIVIGETLLPTLVPIMIDIADAASRATPAVKGFLDDQVIGSYELKKAYEEGRITEEAYLRVQLAHNSLLPEWAREREELIERIREENVERAEELALLEKTAYYYGVYAQASYDARFAIEETADAQRGVVDSTNPVPGIILRAERAWREYEAAQVDVAEAIDETQRLMSGGSIQQWIDSSEDATETSLDLSEGLWGAVAAAEGTPEAFATAALAAGKLSREQAEAWLKTEALRVKMKELGDDIASGAMGWDEALRQLQEFEANLLALPGSKTVTIVLADEYARQSVAEFRRLLEQIPDSKTINFEATWQYGNMGGFTGAGGPLPDNRNPGGVQAPPDVNSSAPAPGPGRPGGPQAPIVNNFFNREAAAIGLMAIAMQRRAAILE